MAASDRTRELAKDGRVALFARAIQGIINDQTSHYISLDTIEEEVERIICPLLDTFERKTQLGEAKRWCHNWYGYDNLGLSGQALETHRENCRDCQRVADLAAQPTPEVKK